MKKNGSGPTTPDGTSIEGISDETCPKLLVSAGDDSVEDVDPGDEPSQADEDTAELPVLRLDSQLASDFAADDDEAPSRASAWLRHMEAEIERLQTRWQSLDAELARSEARVVALQLESDTKDGRIAVLEDRLTALGRERDEQRHTADNERAHAVEARAEQKALTDANEKLRARLQDLETYIEGRRESWAQLNARVDEQKHRLGTLEDALRSGETTIEARDARIAALEATVLDLERKCSETEGRHLEREAAYREVHAALEAKLGEVERLTVDNDRLATRLGEIESTVAAGSAEIEALGASLEQARQEAGSLREELGKAETLTTHMEKKSVEDRELILKLQAEVTEIALERDGLVDRLEKGDERMAVLEDKLGHADTALTELRNQCAVQELRIADLEREIAKKTEVIGAFDRSAERLTRLGRDLHSIHDDTLVSDASVETEPDSAWPRSLIDDDLLFGSDDDDHRETMAHLGESDTGSDTDTDGDTHEDSILADLNVRSGSRPALVRMFVTMDEDEFPGTEYALDKPVMTIGRSKDSDIRLQQLVVSRHHARLKAGVRHTVIEDAGSKNGITVNSRAVDRATLRNGDVVSLGGKLDFQYVELELPPH